MDFDFADLLMDVISRNASDLHLTAGGRADASACAAGSSPMDGYPRLTPTDTREIVYSILTNDQRQRLETDWQIDFAYSIPGHARFRVNAYFQRSAIGAAFRLIPAKITSIDELGLPTAVHEFTQEAARLRARDRPDRLGQVHLAGGDDRRDQRSARRAHHDRRGPDRVPPQPQEVHGQPARAGLGRADLRAGLKAALRQDPDVILVGEMRDLETISTALTAAETGHLVFATLHTQSAPPTIDRIIDVFPAHQQAQVRVQLSVALQGVMTQQLLPTADGSSRVVACEVLVPTPAVRNLIREGKTHQIPSAMQTGSNVGMQTMDAALAGARALGQDHPAPGRGALVARPTSCARLLSGRRRHRNGRVGDGHVTSSRRWTSTGAKAAGEVDAESKQAVADQLKAARPDRPRHRRQGRLEGDQPRLRATRSSRPT